MRKPIRLFVLITVVVAASIGSLAVWLGRSSPAINGTNGSDVAAGGEPTIFIKDLESIVPTKEEMPQGYALFDICRCRYFGPPKTSGPSPEWDEQRVESIWQMWCQEWEMAAVEPGYTHHTLLTVIVGIFDSPALAQRAAQWQTEDTLGPPIDWTLASLKGERIGDKTWSLKRAGSTSHIISAIGNVVVQIRAATPESGEISFIEEAARNIEAKIKKVATESK